MADDGAEPKAETITITVKDQASGEVQFKVKKTTKFGKIFVAYCARRQLQPDSIRFIFDGARVGDDMTPQDLDMEDGDSIDAVIEQVGGAAS